LTSALDCQKDIFCLKEVFINKNLKSKILNKLNQTSKIENLLGSDHSKWEKIRDEKFKDFLELLASLSNKKIFGYKFFEKHFRSFLNQETYLKFLKETNSKIIILERNNILLQYISQLTATSIGCYSCSIKNKDFKKVFQLNPIKLDYDEYIKYNKKIVSIIVTHNSRIRCLLKNLMPIDYTNYCVVSISIFIKLLYSLLF